MKYKHGKAKTRIWNIWSGMKTRCNCKTSSLYPYYGGRGISYDKRWNDFAVFFQDMKDNYSDKLELDRINNDGNYCKENCRWVTKKINLNNKRNSVVYLGKNMEEASIGLGGSKNLVFTRFKKYKWSLRKAFTTPIKN